MTQTIVATCRTCGQEFEPTRDAIHAGHWKTCPRCQPQPDTERRCQECGRVLRATTRELCYSCLTGGSTV